MTSPQTETRNSVFQEAHLRDYWKVVWQGRWTIVGIFAVIVALTAAWTFLQTEIYRATAIVEVQPKARRLAAGQDVSGMGAAGYGWFAEEKYHNTQVEIIRSRDVAGRVVDALGLRADERFAMHPDPVEAFRNRIQVVARRDTGLIEISISGTEPDEVTHWVNQVAEAYVKRNLEKARENVNLAIDSIRTQLSGLQEDFSVAESERFEALEGAQIFGSEEQVEIVREKLKTYNQELTEVQIELSRLRDTLERIRKTRGGELELMSLPVLAEDTTLQDLHRSKVELEREFESVKVELRPEHPDYERLAGELKTLELRIDQQIGSILYRVKTRYDLARDHEEFLERQIRVAEDASLQVAKASSDNSVFRSRAETKRRIVDLVNKTMTEVQFGAEMLTNNVSLLDEASTPIYPIKPRRRVNLAVGAMLGLFLGLGTAFFLDYLDNTFRTPEDIEKYLRLSVLGVIPKIQQDEGLANRAVKEAYQSLRTSIIFSSKNRQRKVILISSTGPQEGKSSTVANLGRMLAAAGDRVIIIDADLRRPTQHLLHDTDRESGVTNYLTDPLDRTDWMGYVKSVTPNNLHVMTCGPIPPSPPELLGSERFSELLGRLREAYDWVLIDSPPAGTLADSTLMASVADMIVMVVQYNSTDRDMVTKAVQRLRAVNETIVGAVLNNVDLDRAYHKDYYYAGYYYYSEAGEKKYKKKAGPAKANVG